MFLESHMIISLISILILFLSFIASFKHQNATIFIVGLIVSIFINKCEYVVPKVKNFFATSDEPKDSNVGPKESTSVSSTSPKESTSVSSTSPKESTSVPSTSPKESTSVPIVKDNNNEKTSPSSNNKTIITAPKMEATNKSKTTTTKQDTKMPEGMTYNKQHLRDMNDDASKPIPPEVAQRLVTNSIRYAVNRNQQRSVYSYGRPLIHEVVNGDAKMSSAVPDFVTFGNVLVGNLRVPGEPTPDAYLKMKPEQNPELLKLVPAKSKLIPSSDFFPNCKSGGIGGNETIDDVDPRDKLRCRYPGIY